VRALRSEDLTERGKAQTVGSAPAHLAIDPSGKYLLTSLYGGGAVVVHPILPDGSIAEAAEVHAHGGKEPHAHQVVADPSGRWLLAVDLGLDTVIVSQLVDGTLRDHRRVAFAPGSGPRHLAFHPAGEYAYVAGELDSTVTVCAWRDGELIPGEVLRAAPDQVTNHPGEITVSADGRFVYVGNRGHNSTAVFATSPDGSALTFVAAPSCGGDWPRHHAIDPSGRWLYVANQRSGDVVWFPIDPGTGIPGAPAGRLGVPGAAHILFA
jgi:6-phosphogluconolactonase (cycloisomerase 2 family)